MERIGTGIARLDEKLGGGFPLNSTTAVIGTFGTGKSTFGMQFLNEGLRMGEPCIFLSLDDDEDSLIEAAMQFGWDFKKYVDDGLLLLIKLSPTDIKTAILRIRSELPQLFESFGAKRCVFDSITLFEMLFNGESERRLLVYELAHTIKHSGATSIITSESDKIHPHSSRFGLIEYMADGVIFLNYWRNGSRKSVSLLFEITKMRKVKHSREIMTYVVAENGIEICSQFDR